MVSGPNTPSANFSLKSEESRQLSVIPGVGIMSCGHIERRTWTLPDMQKASQCLLTMYKEIKCLQIGYRTGFLLESMMSFLNLYYLNCFAPLKHSTFLSLLL